MKWKIGRVVPLHKGKKLSESEMSSFRPISLLSVTSKLVERVVQQQMLTYLETTGQLNQNHNAYRRFHSTSTAIIAMTDALFEATDRNLIATITTVDESCAFDSVIHETLVKKLRLYNFSEQTCLWFKNYLNFHSQYVAIGAKSSSIKQMKSGVPQGSVLGPILYTVYINELSCAIQDDDCQGHLKNTDNLFGNNCLTCGEIPAYADDATIIAASKSRTKNQEQITTNISKVKTFLNSNGLVMNDTKTKIVESMVAQKTLQDCRLSS